MPYYKNNRKKRTNNPNSTPKVKLYTGPIIGTKEWIEYKRMQCDTEPFHSEYECPLECLPVTISLRNPEDENFMCLQQKMMDFGWRLNEKENGSVYFTHPTYNGEEFTTYSYKLTNGNLCRLPIVNRDKDPKGLGCTINTQCGTGFVNVETNEWQSYWDTRTGKRRGQYLDYLSGRQDKRNQYIEMSKIDKSSMVWDKDTPRCNSEIMGYYSPKISKAWTTEVY